MNFFLRVKFTRKIAETTINPRLSCKNSLHGSLHGVYTLISTHYDTKNETINFKSNEILL
jgi:hypothetical protein